MYDSLMYKLSYYRFNEAFGQNGVAQDRVRNQDIKREIHLETVEEAYTSVNWIVRLYKVKDLDNLGRSHQVASKYNSNKATASVKKPTTRKAADRKPHLVA